MMIRFTASPIETAPGHSVTLRPASRDDWEVPIPAICGADRPWTGSHWLGGNWWSYPRR